MSIPEDAAWRGCASKYPQPVSSQDQSQALFWEQNINYLNCVKPKEEDRLAEIVYRSGYQQLDILRHVYRWDVAPPDDVFRNGFVTLCQTDASDDTYCSLYNYVHLGGRPVDSRQQTSYRFLSTTVSCSWFPLVDPGTDRTLYRYEIYAPGGIWIAQTLGNRYSFRGIDEVSFVGGVAAQYIRSAQEFKISCAADAKYPTRERVDQSILINRYFNPEQGTQLNIQLPVFCYRENNQNLPLEIVDYPPQGQERMKGEVYSDTTSWYAGDVANIRSYINAAFRSSRENEVYLFMKNQYVLLNYAPGTSNDKVVNGPLLICKGYTSLTDTPFGEHGIDCAFGLHDSDDAFIFSGNLCAQIYYAPHSAGDMITKGPMTIAAMFVFLKDTEFEKGIDAAFESSRTNEAYLFKGSNCALINFSSDNPHLISVQHISEAFPSLKDTIFETGVEAAFASHLFDEAYLFNRDSFARFNFAPDTKHDYIIDGVKGITTGWTSLATILPVFNSGLDLHDHTNPEADRDHDQV